MKRNYASQLNGTRNKEELLELFALARQCGYLVDHNVPNANLLHIIWRDYCGETGLPHCVIACGGLGITLPCLGLKGVREFDELVKRFSKPSQFMFVDDYLSISNIPENLREEAASTFIRLNKMMQNLTPIEALGQL